MKHNPLFCDAKTYYEALRANAHEQRDCYEMTVLDGIAAGTKLLFLGEQTMIYSEEPSESETICDKMINAADHIVSDKLPGVCKVEDVHLFAEKLGGRTHMIICGAGHVSIALIKIAQMTGFYVTVIDDRPSFCNHARSVGADEVICEPFTPALRAMKDQDAPYFVIVTRGHQYDVDCMHEILQKRHSYIGMMGSKVRVRNLKSRLMDEGFDAALVDSVHMPIGLKIGAQTPEEIAVSIMAEMIACRRKEKENYHYADEMITVLSHDHEKTVRAALAVIIVKKGCGPREAGTKMMILEDGRLIGTIGGGCAEAAVIQKALYCIRNHVCALEHVDMTGAEAAENGLICGGVMDVFIQPV